MNPKETLCCYKIRVQLLCSVCTFDVLYLHLDLDHSHHTTMLKLEVFLFLSTFIALATSLPAATGGQDFVDTVIPIQSLPSQGEANAVGLKIRAYSLASIDEVSSYVAALRFMGMLALQDTHAEIPLKNVVWQAPYNLAQVEMSPQSGRPTVSRNFALECIFQSITWLSQHQFVHAEFTLVADGNYDIVKCTYALNNPGTPLVSDPADANVTQTLDVSVVSITPGYRLNAKDLSNAEVFVNAIGALRAESWQDRNAHMFSFKNVVDVIDAYVEVKGVTSPVTDPEFTVDGFVTTMWRLPLWLLDHGRLAEVSGVIAYDGVPRAKAFIMKGRPPAEGATPDTS